MNRYLFKISASNISAQDDGNLGNFQTVSPTKMWTAVKNFCIKINEK